MAGLGRPMSGDGVVDCRCAHCCRALRLFDYLAAHIHVIQAPRVQIKYQLDLYHNGQQP